jgi:hypothetical protein
MVDLLNDSIRLCINCKHFLDIHLNWCIPLEYLAEVYFRQTDTSSLIWFIQSRTTGRSCEIPFDDY